MINLIYQSNALYVQSFYLFFFFFLSDIIFGSAFFFQLSKTCSHAEACETETCPMKNFHCILFCKLHLYLMLRSQYCWKYCGIYIANLLRISHNSFLLLLNIFTFSSASFSQGDTRDFIFGILRNKNITRTWVLLHLATILCCR